jgi:hypothetical protein
MGERQHYLPRFILRNFSINNEGKLINIFQLSQNKFLYSKELYGQAQEKYLYGKDQKIEEIFGRLETLSSSTISKLKKGDINLTKEEKANIFVFIAFQHCRTPWMAKNIRDYTRLIGHKLSSCDSRYDDIINSLSMTGKEPYIFLLELASNIVYSMIDLRIGLLECNDNSQFIIGQHPVVLINPYLSFRKWKGGKRGLGIIGTLIIMPISPRYCLILFDHLRYRLRNMKRITKLTEEDVNKINYFQFLQTTNCIYFKEKADENYFKGINGETKAYRESIKANITNAFDIPNDNNDSQRPELLMTKIIDDISIDQNLFFLGYIDIELERKLPTKLDIQEIKREYIKFYEEKNGIRTGDISTIIV